MKDNKEIEELDPIEVLNPTKDSSFELESTSTAESNLAPTSDNHNSNKNIEELLQEDESKETVEPKEIVKLKETVESKKTTESKKTNENKNNDKVPLYVNYEARIGVNVLIIIIMFTFATISLLKAISIKNNVIIYDETSNIDYRVCLSENDYYKEACLGMGMEYLSAITENIPVTFNYTAVYTSKIDYNYEYYVQSTIKVFKPDEEDKVLYTSDKKLLEEKKIKGNANVINISENIEIPFSEYNEYITNYKNNYGLDSDAYIEAILYLKDGNSKKNIGKVIIPLSTQTFNISKDELKNNNMVAPIDRNIWKDGTVLYIAISCIFCLIGIIMIIKLLIFIFKSVTKKSEYNKKLEQILREYDRIIVQIKNSDYITDNKRVIKVSNFLELLDARDTLEKPIVHIRVNNIKSEFYVEDVDKIYKYVMKESDFER